MSLRSGSRNFSACGTLQNLLHSRVIAHSCLYGLSILYMPETMPGILISEPHHFRKYQKPLDEPKHISTKLVIAILYTAGSECTAIYKIAYVYKACVDISVITVFNRNPCRIICNRDLSNNAQPVKNTTG